MFLFSRCFGGSWPIINSGLTLESIIGDVRRTAKAFYEVNERINADIIMVGVGSTALLIKALGGKSDLMIRVLHRSYLNL